MAESPVKTTFAPDTMLPIPEIGTSTLTCWPFTCHVPLTYPDCAAGDVWLRFGDGTVAPLTLIVLPEALIVTTPVPPMGEIVMLFPAVI
jgi:hypothetical protein